MIINRIFSKTDYSYYINQLKAHVSSKLNPIPKRYGYLFERYYEFLNNSQWWSKSELEEYQMKELSKLLVHCYENVPYYREIFKSRGLKPSHVQDLDDLRKLPFITKNDIRKNLPELTAKNIPKRELVFETTSGSTGTPLGLYLERKTHIIREAFDWRFHNWSGYKFGDRCAVLRGIVIEPKGRLWKYDPIKNYLILSTYDITKGNILKYVQKIEQFKPKVIRGFPSALELFTKLIEANNLEINKNRNIKTIFTSSETIDPAQRDFIERIFKAKISDLYGNVEQASRFGECSYAEGYHEFIEYGITELIGENDKPIKNEGVVGEIVATAFTNYATPLIRYRTKDLARRSDRNCGCGRELPLFEKIEGKLQHLIQLKDGRLVRIGHLLQSHSPFFSKHFEKYSRINKIQFIQEKRGEILAKIVKGKDFSWNDAENIKNAWLRNVDYQLNIDIMFVEDIPLTRSGKHKFLIQKLPIEKYYSGELYPNFKGTSK